jgi:hypothetical protein
MQAALLQQIGTLLHQIRLWMIAHSMYQDANFALVLMGFCLSVDSLEHHYSIVNLGLAPQFQPSQPVIRR